MIKLRFLGWGDYPGLFMWALNVIIYVLMRARENEKERESDLTTAEK